MRDGGGTNPKPPTIIRATMVVTAIVLLVKGAGFAEKVLLAYFFGTGIEVDAYLVAYSLPFSAFIVLREVVKPAFLPTFLRTLRSSEQEGWRLFSVIATLLLVLLAAATVTGVFVAVPLISVAAPGFVGEQRALAVRLTRIAMPALLLLGLSTLTTATLHAQKRFTLPALGDFSFRAGPLILLLALAGLAGFRTAAPRISTTDWVQGAAAGVVLGALGKLLIEMVGLRRHLRQALGNLTLDVAFPPVRTVGRLAAPLLMALFFSLFVGPLVENAFASKSGVGAVSALAYARKIAETLTTILPYTLGLVLLPFSAEMAAGQDDQALARTLTKVVRALSLIFLPVTVGLMMLREPFIRLLFERGAFTTASTQLTAGPLLFYALALLPFALEVVIIQFYFARQDTFTPVLTDVVSFALNVALIPPLMGALGLGGIALAAAIAKALKVLALLILFGRRVPAFRLASLGRFAGQMVLASLAAAAVLLAFRLASGPEAQGGPFPPLSRHPADGQGLIALLAPLLGGGVLGGGTFLVVASLLRVDEIRDLWRRARTVV